MQKNYMGCFTVTIKSRIRDQKKDFEIFLIVERLVALNKYQDIIRKIFLLYITINLLQNLKKLSTSSAASNIKEKEYVIIKSEILFHFTNLIMELSIVKSFE
jgi:hypothetical protein